MGTQGGLDKMLIVREYRAKRFRTKSLIEIIHDIVGYTYVLN